jgi:fumarylacetoacetate (FAA) hydrolase family protein
MLHHHHTPPEDAYAGTWVGRAWLPAGPAVVTIRHGHVFDITPHAATTSALFDHPNPAAFLGALPAESRLGPVEELLANSDPAARDPARPWLLAPVDLQAIKACGVTFADSLLERLVEEHAKGDAAAAESVRRTLVAEIGTDLSAIRPGSPEAAALREALLRRGQWSQYLEVGLGPDAEVFTKAQPMSAVGFGAAVGIHPASAWNNPEPEIVLAVSAAGRIVGATLGNDVNLRDVEGRSALLLGRAKDNNASAAIGPFVRLFDDTFTLDDVRRAEVTMRVEGTDGFVMHGSSSLSRISRDPADLVAQTIGSSHQYPDGFVLYLGTMFAPTALRDGAGFTHKRGDIVAIHTPRLGTLVNRVETCDRVPPWDFGVRALIGNLASRGLLGTA